ncbi:FadR/GntR family transcriptional regulator [Microbacterium sp. NPDC090007]|uniref:FadR/GntR family transcriptional regulator n=1 Tax=Microbacterium sp. NPDC090007 TaxID=3364204 RepID=UPI0038246483
MSPSRRNGTEETVPRVPIDRIGSRVLQDLVELIVTGEMAEGDFLPPEQALCDEFGVSRTVIRESVKRMQEKGLVVVAQGRGTQVRSYHEWNVLDPLVFDALVRHDESLGVLDEVSVVRASLEGVMASEVAHAHRADDIEQIESHLEQMRTMTSDNAAFLEADLQFHLAVMAASRNQIAGTIARSLFVRARQSSRWDGNGPVDAVRLTLEEHERVFACIEAGDHEAARVAMEEHILGSWRRRRLPDGAHHLSP